MDLNLRGKTAVVVGGSKGIGRAICLALAKEGAHVAACARDRASLDALKAEVQAFQVPCFVQAADATKPEELSAFLDAAHAQQGRIDVLVNNASALGGPDTEEAWQRNIQLDLMASVRASEQVIPWMKAAGGGNILFIGSVSGMESSGTSLAYSAIKAAVISYSKGLARKLGPSRIRVNTIAPGMIEFPGGVWDVRRRSEPEVYAKFCSEIPWGRPGHPDEIANLAAFLASDLSAFLTGVCVAVDGGKHRANI